MLQTRSHLRIYVYWPLSKWLAIRGSSDPDCDSRHTKNLNLTTILALEAPCKPTGITVSTQNRSYKLFHHILHSPFSANHTRASQKPRTFTPEARKTTMRWFQSCTSHQPPSGTQKLLPSSYCTPSRNNVCFVRSQSRLHLACCGRQHLQILPFLFLFFANGKIVLIRKVPPSHCHQHAGFVANHDPRWYRCLV